MALTRVVGAAARKEGGRVGGRVVMSGDSVEDWASKGGRRTLRLFNEEEGVKEGEEEAAASAGEKRLCLLLRRVLPVRLLLVLPPSLLLLLLLPPTLPLPEEGDEDDDGGGGGGGRTKEERRLLLLASRSPRCLLLIWCPDVAAIHLLLLLVLPQLLVDHALAADTGIKNMGSRSRNTASGAVAAARHLGVSCGGIVLLFAPLAACGSEVEVAAWGINSASCRPG